jgi:magnesium chelatase family protein
VIGELGLSGATRPVRGGLCAALLAREKGMKGVLLPAANAQEAAIVPGIAIIPIENLAQAIQFAKDPSSIKGLYTPSSAMPQLIQEAPRIDFADIRGQLHVKRALEIAAAGGHNIVMSGPPGSGKTMLAKAMTGIMPEMTLEEALEVTRIHSISGMLEGDRQIITQRPFRAPHHTVSYAGLIGGGHIPRPGEVTLAHNGILFLDELPEFSRTVLEVLRQPLEDRNVTISRANGNYTFPTNFICIAAMNPCPCGFLGHPTKPCTDSSLQVNRYRSKISGPLWDRIDMHIDVPALRYSEMLTAEKEESSSVVRERVKAARARQRRRLGPTKCNAMLSTKEIKETARLDYETMEILQMAMEQMGFSARVCDRMRKVARTIADLEGAENIEKHHLMEAIGFRSLQVQAPESMLVYHQT